MKGSVYNKALYSHELNSASSRIPTWDFMISINSTPDFKSGVLTTLHPDTSLQPSLFLWHNTLPKISVHFLVMHSRNLYIQIYRLSTNCYTSKFWINQNSR